MFWSHTFVKAIGQTEWDFFVKSGNIVENQKKRNKENEYLSGIALFFRSKHIISMLDLGTLHLELREQCLFDHASQPGQSHDLVDSSVQLFPNDVRNLL